MESLHAIISQYIATQHRGNDEQSGQRESEQGFVYPAHHDTGVLVPMRNITQIPQCPAHVPRE